VIPKQTIFLVVDDYESMRNIIVKHIRSFGVLNANILKAGNGAEAMEILKDKQVHFILSDWNMPVMSGIDLLKAVRADDRLSHLPFIMITAEANREQIEEAIYSGISDLIIKPYTLERLHDRIIKALNSKNRAGGIIRAKTSSRQAMESAAPGAKELSRPSILAVDDTPDNLHMIVDLFADEYLVLVANSGEKALEIIQSEKQPDLVLLDIMMPGIDGFTVFKRMREHPNSEHIPVIFVTSMTGEEAFLEGLELGAIDFVTKPINPAVLKLRVRNFMRYVELNRRLQDDCDLMMEKAKLQDEVEHIVRHDIKGPLAGMIGIVQDLAADSLLNKSQVKQLRTVEETALQAVNIINLSLELFKIETGSFELNPQPVMIEEILRRIAEISRAAFSGKHLHIDMETNVRDGDARLQTMGDSMFCYSLFHNLIQNACEAAPEGTAVNIKYLDEHPLRICIRNEGAVPAGIREGFFDKYVTLGKKGGTGIGTYSAKLLAEAQHGKIEMTTSDSKNETAVIVTLPRPLDKKINVNKASQFS
jgi:two-component system, sensor histidine kinase and response regulator